MAEFRKREDITQEIDILQTWSEMGAPRMGDVGPSLQSLVKSVDPELMRGVGEGPAAPPAREVPPREGVPPGEDMPPGGGAPPEGPPETPSPFADLPPGDEEEQPSRGALLPIALLLLLGGAGLVYMLTRWEPFTHANGPVPTGTGERPSPGLKPGTGPKATARPSAATAPTATPTTTAQPTSFETLTPEALPTGAPTAGASAGPAGSAAPTGTSKSTGARPPRGVPSAAHPHVVAAARQSPPPVVREYHVRTGDSLSAIARDQLGDMERWHELYEANRDQIADPNVIEPGQTLKMPAPAPAPTYQVKPGDTLKAIAAARLGDANRWREIYDLNRSQLPSPGVLPPGITLKLPASAAPTGGPTGRQPGVASGAIREHVVRHGDSLSLLAKRYLGSAQRWPEIYYLNSHKIANPRWIFPGQRLAIPSPYHRTRLRYVVRSGDTLWAIAGRELGNPLRWTRLYQANRQVIRDPHWIYPGQILRLP